MGHWRISLQTAHNYITMDLQSVLENGNASVTIQITAKDLKEFADYLLTIATRQAHEMQVAADGESYYTKAEVLALFNICPTTLWHWGNAHFLQPVKVGRKVLYRKKDVQHILKTREDRV